MMTMQTLFFGSIAAFVFLLWFNAAVRRRRMEKVALRYLERSAPRRSAGKTSSSPLVALLILGLLLLGTALALANIRDRYMTSDLAVPDLPYISTVYQLPPKPAGPPGEAGTEPDRTALGAPRKTGVYHPKGRPAAPGHAQSGSVAAPSLSEGYGIQIVALADRHRAEQQLDEVKAKLPQATVNLCLSQQNAALPYKVILGLHPDEAAARQSLSDVRRLYPGSFPVSFRDLILLN